MSRGEHQQPGETDSAQNGVPAREPLRQADQVAAPADPAELVTDDGDRQRD